MRSPTSKQQMEESPKYVYFLEMFYRKFNQFMNFIKDSDEQLRRIGKRINSMQVHDANEWITICESDKNEMMHQLFTQELCYAASFVL